MSDAEKQARRILHNTEMLRRILSGEERNFFAIVANGRIEIYSFTDYKPEPVDAWPMSKPTDP